MDSTCIVKCDQHYSPVCAANGQTFPNRCYAECQGYSVEDTIDGSCESYIDCVKCNQNQRCVAKSQICLTSTDCPQYECITDPIDCQLFGANPVCDINGVNHHNLCWLLKKRQEFAYYGKCLIYCSHSGPVCALNGITYPSECVSLSHSVPVDYFSACNHTNTCDGIKCPDQPLCPHQQFRHTLANTCCPICGSVAKLIYDKITLKSINSRLKASYSVTVEELAKHLKQLLRLFGCQLYTYLSLEGYIVVIVRPTARVATVAQLRQCHQELVRVVTLINNQSPVISLQLPLSLLISGRSTVVESTGAPDKHYAGESKQVLKILDDMQSDATHHNPYHHYGQHSPLRHPASHEGHNNGHNQWDNVDKIWDTGAGAHHGDYDKYGNHGYKHQYLDIGNGYHDRHNDGLNTGNFEGYDDRSLWSRDRGQDHERNMRWDRELENFATFIRNVVKKANAGKSGHLSKYHDLDNGAHYGLKQLDDNTYNNYGGRGRHSGHGWHELDRYQGNKGQYTHGSGYRDNHYPLPHSFH